MPKFIGNQIDGAKIIQDNAPETNERVKLSFSQARLMPPEQVLCSLDTTDRGSKGSLAKRWYRWFSHPKDILSNKRSTANMIAKAKRAKNA